MAGIENIFDVAGRSMSAQLVRLNTIASNLANAGNISGTEEEAYRAMKPIFQTTYAENVKQSGISTTEVSALPPQSASLNVSLCQNIPLLMTKASSSQQQ